MMLPSGSIFIRFHLVHPSLFPLAGRWPTTTRQPEAWRGLEWLLGQGRGGLPFLGFAPLV